MTQGGSRVYVGVLIGVANPPRSGHTQKMMRFGLLTLLVLACEPTPMMTTSGFDETTTGSSSGTEAVSTSTEGETTTGAPDLTSGTETDGATTGDETTGDASTGEASTGEEQTCPDPRGECLATGVWCVDLALFCERIDLADVSPNFCEGLAGVCATGEVAPCETCDGLVEQCEIGGAAMSCEAIAAECACLAAG